MPGMPYSMGGNAKRRAGILLKGARKMKLRWFIPTFLLLVWIGILVAFGAVEPAAPKGATDPSPHVCVIP